VRPLHYDNGKIKIKRYAIYVAIILMGEILQNSSLAFPEIFGARAFLLLPLSVAIAMHEREVPSGIFGAVIGVLWDISCASDGFNTFVVMLLCATCSICISHFMRKNIITALVLSSGAVCIYDILYIMINLLAEGAGNPIGRMFAFYLPSFVYTMLFVPVFYYLIDWVFDSNKTE
jgi:rod shape-determining protein MreD